MDLGTVTIYSYRKIIRRLEPNLCAWLPIIKDYYAIVVLLLIRGSTTPGQKIVLNIPGTTSQGVFRQAEGLDLWAGLEKKYVPVE